MPKVSIIMPAYNKENYIQKTLDSIIQQKFIDFELIIIDDGSTDKTRNILEEYRVLDKRIKIHHIENGGVSNARNIGLRHAVGDWIQFLDADDLIDPEYLINAIQLAEKKDVDILFSYFFVINENGDVLKKVSIEKQGIMDQLGVCSCFIEEQYKNGFFGYISNKLIRKEVIEKSGAEFPIGIKLAEDLDFYARLYPYVQKAYLANLNSFYYLQTESNYLNNDLIDYVSQLNVHLDIKKWFIQSDLYKKYYQILNTKVSEYVYYIFFYANENKEDLKKYKKFISDNLNIMESIKPHYFTGFEKSVLKAVYQNKYNKLVMLFKWRTIIRSAFRRIRRNE